MYWLLVVLDVVITLLPILFFVLASLAAYLNNRPLSSLGRQVGEAQKIAPTVYPINFPAIVSRLMKSIALWRVRRGENFGVLKQLVGSQSLTSAAGKIHCS